VPRASKTLANEFRIKLRSLDSTRTRVEELHTTTSIPQKDVARVYESLFLNAVTLFEAFLEDLFIGLLVVGKGVVSGHSSIHPRIVVRSHQVAREVALQGRRYLDWLPYEQTGARAEVFFTGGRPFTLLSKPLKDDIQKCVWIRNAIAHRSDHARTVFLRNVVGSLSLPPRERIPSGYLRSILAAYPKQTRYEYLVARLSATAAFLAT
jgi:hypothetical protein